MTLTQKMKIAAGLILAIVLAAGAVWITSLKSERDLQAAQLLAMSRENLALSVELEANRAALAKREAEAARLAKDKQALAARLEEVYANNPAARAWADALCPADVLECLRR